MIHVNTSYFESVFASFSSIVEGSAEFPCNNETLHICRLNTFSVVLKSFFFLVLKLLSVAKWILEFLGFS